ncbi:hypothetical protein CBQ28_23540 [Pseudoalteromonas sp. GCY]|uniref:hypothetical protein n=1 Tax=Pseudoalteromonas sp. GCY TaxID=2003316 RepID=UPI000BFEF37F|nr:hypothetical protein [Pseudoalteromonas sp. GCY]PHI34683.1 hypothetical protein CBQ28_23540 [Pseudoalteromonas sp. GCY]QQQ64715.1 hypothetical protein JJQ94_03645 [Pseudoalteromonas sp. GCY]
MKNAAIGKFLLVSSLILFISSCASPELRFVYKNVEGKTVKNISEKYLVDNNFTVQTSEVKNYKVFGKSEVRKTTNFFGSEILEWEEITIIAQELPFQTPEVKLLVQIQVWRQPPIGNKELVESISNSRRLEGEQALAELDSLIRQAINEIKNNE